MWKRIIISLVGLILCGIGVAMFLYSGMGVDPASVFELGIGRVFGISYGTSSALINVIILLIVFFQLLPFSVSAIQQILCGRF